jgi:hypothetical protein
LPPVPARHALVDDILDGTRPVAPSPLLRTLLDDDSDQALRPSDPHLLESYASCVSHTIVQKYAPSTQAKHRTGWNLWVEFMQQWHSPPLRRDDPSRCVREQFLRAAFILWARRRCRSSLPGRLTVKPASIVAHLHAVAAVHAQSHLSFDTRGMLQAAVHYLSVEYELVHGPESLVPHRREGFSRAHLKSMLAVDTVTHGGLPLSSRSFPVLVWESWLGRNIAACLAVASSGGFRKAELTLAPGVVFDAMHMSRASLFWVLQGVICRFPSLAQLHGMRSGDQAGLLVCCSKADNLALHFLPHPLYFNFVPGDPDNTALRLRTLYLMCPVLPSLARSTPMFTMSPQAQPFRRDFVDLVLKALLLTFMSPEIAALYSFHSFRIGLACALRAAGAPDWVIMALLRWRSDKSLLTYARINRTVSANWIDDSAAQIIDSMQAPNVARVAAAMFPPHTLPGEAYSFLQRAAEISDSLLPTDLTRLASEIPATDDDSWMQQLRDLRLDAADDGGGVEVRDDL